MKTLENSIRSMIEASDKEMESFLTHCYYKRFNKKEILSDDDGIIDEVYFVEQGIIRVKIIDTQGNEHTTHFAIENQFICDYSAFLLQERSKYQLEAMEDVTAIVLPRKGINWGYKNMKQGEKLGRLIAEYYYIYLDTRIQQMYTLTPLQRYDLMNEIFPNIHNRVPQHMIASYLGITPIHLSRLKSKGK